MKPWSACGVGTTTTLLLCLLAGLTACHAPLVDGGESAGLVWGSASDEPTMPPPPPPPPPPVERALPGPPAAVAPPAPPALQTQADGPRLSAKPRPPSPTISSPSARVVTSPPGSMPAASPALTTVDRAAGRNPRYARRQIDPLMRCDSTRPFKNAYWGGSLSVLPNLGVALEVGTVWWRNDRHVWSWELEVTYQFLDDEDFVDDGNPSADDWWQVQWGAKLASHPLRRRHWTGRAGLVWFNAGKNPNIVQEPGNYVGIYGGIGFETDLNANLTMGPELSAMVVYGTGGAYVVPQFNWHIIWNF